MPVQVMDDDEACQDAWSVMRGEPNERARRQLAQNRRSWWIRYGTVVVVLAVLLVAALTDEDVELRLSPSIESMRWIIGGLGLALFIVGTVLFLSYGRSASVGPDSTDSFSPQHKRALWKIIRSGPIPGPGWLLIAQHVADRHRNDWTEIIRHTGLVTIFTMQVTSVNVWLLLLLGILAVAWVVLTIGSLYRTIISRRFLDRYPATAA